MHDDDRSNDGWGPSGDRVSMWLMAGVATFVAADLTIDLAAGMGLSNVLVDLVIVVLAASYAVVQWRRLLASGRQLAVERDGAEGLRREIAAWQREARETLEQLNAKIDDQFDAWGLSSAERHIAIHLLRGLSIKEIAALRDTSERTVRQQSQAIYRKCGLSGRNALAGFFLSGLVPKRDADPRIQGACP